MIRTTFKFQVIVFSLLCIAEGHLQNGESYEFLRSRSIENRESRDLFGRQLPSLDYLSFKQAQSHASSKLVQHGLHFASTVTENEVSKFTYYQTYLDSSLEVLGGELIVFSKRDPYGGVTQDVVDNMYDLGSNINLKPTITSELAVGIAQDYCAHCTSETPIVRLAILPHGFCQDLENHDGQGNLVWRVQLMQPIDAIVFFIDARSGTILLTQDETRRYTAETFYSGTQNIPSYWVTSQYYLEDPSKGTAVKNCLEGNCTTVGSFESSNGNWTSPTALYVPTQVMYGVTQVLQYLNATFGRNGIDGLGGPDNILSADGTSHRFSHNVHAGINQTFSQWTTNGIFYGDGDGQVYLPMVAVDIVAHEIGHGIIQYTANLNGYGEPGALEESFGDVLSALVDVYLHGERNETWRFGEDVFTPNYTGDAIRFIDYPHLKNSSKTSTNYTKYDDPDHYSEIYNGTLDNGGVHPNSGIANKAFYLLAKGGVHHLTPNISMTGIGIAAAAAIWWRAYTFYSSSTTTFSGFRTNMQYAARDLYTQTEVTEVGIAWGLCGVGAIPSPFLTQNITDSNLEGTTGWTVVQQTSSVAVTWVQRAALGQAHSGVKYLQFGVSNGVAGYASTNFSIPVNAYTASLSYWTYITTTEPTNATHDQLSFSLFRNDNNALIDLIDNVYNLNANTGYVLRTINLISYKSYFAYPLRLTISVYTDNNYPTTFRVDDVAVNVTYY